MKRALFFMSISFFLISCHKNKSKPVTCDNYSIGMTIGINVTLLTTNTNTGELIKNYHNIIQVGNNYSEASGAYDHIHNLYYLYGSIGNTQTAVLYRVNVGTGTVDTLGYPVADPVYGIIFFDNLVCNSTTGKLYFFGRDSYNGAGVIYEITPNTTGYSQRLVCNISSGWSNNVSSPVIDESTGYIYYVVSSSSSSGNEYTFMKVNSADGSSSFVAYSGASALADLIYNNNDSMFYGVKSNMLYPNVLRVSFISINPTTGVINTVVDSINNYVFTATFDYCNNLYIYGYDCLEPSTGKLVEKFSSSAIGADAGIY